MLLDHAPEPAPHPARRRRTFVLLAGLVAMGIGFGAHAQTTYPAKPIKLVVPFPPGGATDLVARALGERLQARLGRAVLIENKAGASTLIGADAVAKSPADGYTLLVSGSSTFSVVPALKPNMPYDARKDLALVAIVARAPLVLVAGPATQVKSLAELVALAKSRPGDLTYATFGSGSAPHLAGEMLSHEAGIKMLPVPYRGSAPASMALISGEISVAYDTIASAGPHIKAGKLRPLAVSDTHRASSLPDVPTLAELKLPKATFEGWYGVAAPAGIPDAVLQVLTRELTAIMALPEIKEKWQASGLEPVLLDSGAFMAKVQAETATYAAVGKRASITLD
jgi:tripartite-type tricarboxylate transporter receptor subunit TctC